MNETLPPLYFEPVYQSYVWGGDRIPRTYRRPLPDGVYAESWEISARPEGMSVVADGAFKGRTLEEMTAEYGARLLGEKHAGGPFPLLLKILDARERLSLQVHPSNETAERSGGEPKTEMWVVLAVDPGAAVFAGLQPGVDRAAFEQALDEGRIEDVLQRHEVKPGDAVFIPGGTVHAIDAGCLLMEIQQSSNTTYRVHDWGRVGADGKPRETHREQALRVMNFGEQPSPMCVPTPLPPQGGSARWLICACPWFTVERIETKTRWHPSDSNGDMEIWFVAEGQGAVRWTGGHRAVPPGTSLLLPAEVRGACFAPEPSGATLLRIRLP